MDYISLYSVEKAFNALGCGAPQVRRCSAVKQIFVSEDEGGGRKKKGHVFQIKSQNINLMLIIFPRERK